MIRNVIILIFWAGFPLSIVAQNSVSGILKQDDNKTIPLANIRLLDATSNVLVGYTTANMEGGYQIQVKDFGKYLLVASCIGYKEERKLIDVTTYSTIINFILKENIQQLSEIKINTKSLDVYQKNDTISFNLKKLTNGTETNLKDVLKKLPGISLENGKIYAQGKIIDKVLINGDVFTLNQRTLSETLAAKMIGGIDLLKDYKENTILSNFNTTQQQALNLKIKKEYLGVFKGEVGLGNGLIEKYSGRGFGYNLGDKFKTSIIIDANNTGENPITITEFIELKGGILSLFGNRPSPLSNEISLNNSIIPLSSIYASRVKNEFGSCNINYKYSPRTKISGSVLVFNTAFNSFDESRSVYTLGDKTITVFDKSNTQKKTIMEQGNFSLEYRKSSNENFVYKVSQSFSIANNDQEINTSNFVWPDFFQESILKNQLIDQDLSFLKRYSNAFIFYSSLHHTFENKEKNSEWFSKEANQTMNQAYYFKRNDLSFEAQIVYKPYKIQYEYNFGIRYNASAYKTNLEGENNILEGIYSDIDNALDFNKTNLYSNLSINKKYGFFHFLASITPSYFNVASQKNFFLFYNFKTDVYFSKNNHFDFSIQNDYTIIETQKAFSSLFANSYRDFATSSLQLNTFTEKKSYNLNYYYSKLLSGTNIYMNFSYSELKNAITTNTETFKNAQYDITNYIPSPLQKRYIIDLTIEQRLPDLPIRLKLKGNFDKNDFTTYSQGDSNAITTKKYDGTFSFQTNFKIPLNINGGIYYENTKNNSSLWNTSNKLITYKPYLTFEYEHKGFVANVTGTYNELANGSNKIKYFDLSPQLKYKKNDSPWEFSLEGNNLLNLNTIELISVDYGNNYLQTSKYSRLSGYLLVKIKRFF